MMLKVSNFNEACEFLNTFIRPIDYQSIHSEHIQNNPLKRMEYFLFLLGNPHNSFPSVVVSGTSGKGSTTYMISGILSKSGYKTGMTISPHLVDIRERLQINGKCISQTLFVDLLNKLLPYITVVSESTYGAPSYFEILLALTFLYFSIEKVDIAIIEVGLEGKFDGTNILQPLVFILTNISLDHTQILGNTIIEIAHEATDRIKNLKNSLKNEKAVVLTGVTQPSVIQIVEKMTNQAAVSYKRMGKDFDYKVRKENKDGLLFDFIDDTEPLSHVCMPIVGSYQIKNACLAIKACLQLRTFCYVITNSNIFEALSCITIPGRFENITISDHPVIYDGAHNPAKINSFITAFHRIYKNRKSIFIIAFSKGHGVENMLKKIVHIANEIILTEYDAITDMGKDRMVSVHYLYHFIHDVLLFDEKKIHIETNLKKSLGKGILLAERNNGIVVVTGSLYLVGNLMELQQVAHL